MGVPPDVADPGSRTGLGSWTKYQGDTSEEGSACDPRRQSISRAPSPSNQVARLHKPGGKSPTKTWRRSSEDSEGQSRTRWAQRESSRLAKGPNQGSRHTHGERNLSRSLCFRCMNRPHSKAKSDGVIGRIATVLVSVTVLAGCSTSTNSATTSPGVVTTIGSSRAASTVPTGSTPPGLETYEDPWGRAEQLGLVSPDGEYVGPVDSNGDPLIFEPVTGYGDLSGQDRFDDEGFKVRMEGTALVTEVPPEQEEVFNAAVDNCTLRYFPPQGSDRPSGEDLEARYGHLLQVAECISRAGYEVPTPPTVESFVDCGGTNWDPFDLLQPPFDISLEDYQALDARCNPPLAP